VKYDREPSKSTWQVDGQAQDLTSNEKNEPRAAQTQVHFLVHYSDRGQMTSTVIYCPCVTVTLLLHHCKNISDHDSTPYQNHTNETMRTSCTMRICMFACPPRPDLNNWNLVVLEAICPVYGVCNCNWPASGQNVPF